MGIIGGGPAGSAAAGYLAKAGVRCVVFERELFPRPHVGESFVPATTRVLRDLDFIDQMEEAGFPRKYGAAWTSSARPTYSHDFQDLPSEYNVDVRFEERQQPGVDRNYTYHVDRGLFDMMLLRHAGDLGADVREGVRVSRVDCEGDPFPVITATAGGKDFRTPVRVVLDASGRHTTLGSQLRLKVTDPVFNQFAIHTWFEGFDRGSGPKADYIFIHFLPVINTWVWQIPVTTSVTSFGVVTQKESFAKSRASREQFFWDCIGTRPELLEKLRQSRQVRPWKEEGDYSYAMKQICGTGFALIGDAARFVDPIFSSGVSIALNSARLVAVDVLRGLERGVPFTRESFQDFEATMRRGTNNWYKFITLYYRLNVLFTYFVSDRKYRTQVLQLLQGDLYDEDEPPVLTKMRELAKAVEENENHIWHSMLGTLTANAFRPEF
ncbi:MAG TPA: NAD(P)/FAD-dependent oxidoreductase [Candidatus Binatia bacterium]|nr:NAD(P)/FAD-dependent oxidoreductase [Candidatus Binatia bacterium]